MYSIRCAIPHQLIRGSLPSKAAILLRPNNNKHLRSPPGSDSCAFVLLSSSPQYHPAYQMIYEHSLLRISHQSGLPVQHITGNSRFDS